jgi:glucan 1,3-beta-glucosidase
VSYAPFRDGQTPLDLATQIDPRQIEEDLVRLKQMTDCVRTYSNDFNLDKVPEIARRVGLKVIQGLWLSGHADRNALQIETAVRLAKTYPDVIQAVVVGNEVLLRGELSAVDLANTIRSVKAQVPVPVTYADVWEFWLRNRDLAATVDFVTVHILPYWEDVPIAADRAAAHVEAIHRRVAEAFPGKDVLIGEFGWPSQGRMREGALPSPANQARVLHDVLTTAQRGRYRVNVIEAFDQPWKRYLEGTVGGYWGLMDAETRQPKFAWAEAVSNHPHWRWQAAGGVMLASVMFFIAWWSAARRPHAFAPQRWMGAAVAAVAAGICIGWAVASLVIEGFGLGGWLRLSALAAAAALVPLTAAAAITGNVAIPPFAAVLGRASTRPRDPIALACGWSAVVVTVLALLTMLGLAFDPRYRDFPCAALTAAVVPLLLASLLSPSRTGRPAAAETLAASVLGLSAIYVLINEGVANWQSVWVCVAILAHALTLRRVRAAPG